MRILHLIPYLVSGGAERQLTYLALQLASQGHEVHVGYLHDSQVPDVLTNSSVRLHGLACSNAYDPKLIGGIYRLLRKVKPDVMQTWILQMDILGGLMSKVTRTPWVLREPASAKLWTGGLKTALRRFMGRRADVIVSNSVEGDKYWQPVMDDRHRRIIVNAVPVAAIEGASPADVSVFDGRPIVIFAGRFDAQKNVETLVKALISVSQRISIAAILMGEGPLKTDVQSLINSSDTGQQIQLRNYANDLWSVMKSARALISISHFEGRPNVVLEAMAAGCPLIVSDIPEHREILDERACCFVHDIDDVEAVADAILRALSDAALSQVRRLHAREIVAEFTIERLGREYEAMYRTVVAERQRSSAI